MTAPFDTEEYEEVIPPRPRTTAPAAGALPPPVDPSVTPKAAAVPKRAPIARGTYAIGATAVAGTVLAIVGAGAGAVALVATGSGAVLIPLAVWSSRSKSRTGRRSTARRSDRSRSPRSRSHRAGGGLFPSPAGGGRGSGGRGGGGGGGAGRSRGGLFGGGGKGGGPAGGSRSGMFGGGPRSTTRKTPTTGGAASGGIPRTPGVKNPRGNENPWAGAPTRKPGATHAGTTKPGATKPGPAPSSRQGGTTQPRVPAVTSATRSAPAGPARGPAKPAPSSSSRGGTTRPRVPASTSAARSAPTVARSAPAASPAAGGGPARKVAKPATGSAAAPVTSRVGSTAIPRVPSTGARPNPNPTGPGSSAATPGAASPGVSRSVASRSAGMPARRIARVGPGAPAPAGTPTRAGTTAGAPGVPVRKTATTAAGVATAAATKDEEFGDAKVTQPRDVGTWDPTRRKTRRGRGAARINGGLYQWGSATRQGAGHPTTLGAARRAYRRYHTGHNPTLTGWMGRVAGGVAAAVPAAVARLAWNTTKRVAKSMKAMYRPPKKTPPPAVVKPVKTAAAAPVTQVLTNQVPPPAFTAQPSPTASQSSANPASGNAGNPTVGGNPMSALFPPRAAALDFYGACGKWTPAANGISGAIWNLSDALPLIVDSLAWVANGYGAMVANCQRDLHGGLHPSMAAAMLEVYTPLAAAATKARELQSTFARIPVYADAINRRGVRGSAALNVHV